MVKNFVHPQQEYPWQGDLSVDLVDHLLRFCASASFEWNVYTFPCEYVSALYDIVYDTCWGKFRFCKETPQNTAPPKNGVSHLLVRNTTHSPTGDAIQNSRFPRYPGFSVRLLENTPSKNMLTIRKSFRSIRSQPFTCKFTSNQNHQPRSFPLTTAIVKALFARYTPQISRTHGSKSLERKTHFGQKRLPKKKTKKSSTKNNLGVAYYVTSLFKPNANPSWSPFCPSLVCNNKIRAEGCGFSAAESVNSNIASLMWDSKCHPLIAAVQKKSSKTSSHI